MTDSPFDGSNSDVTVTIKYGKGYEESWAVFRGSAERVRESLLSYFGFEASEGTLHEVVLEATRLAHSTAAVAASMGGRVITGGESKPAWKAAKDAKAEGTPAAPPADPHEDIKAEIENAADVDTLKRIWAEHQEAFKDDALMAVWKAKGKALTS